MGCLNAKPSDKFKQRQPENKSMSSKADLSQVDIFSTPRPGAHKLPPIKAAKKSGKKSQSGKRRANSISAGRANGGDPGMRGMVQFQDRQGYVAVFDTRVLLKYNVRGLIGQGRSSDIFRAEHKSTKQPYAIKSIDKLRSMDCDVELAVLRRASHPNILELIEVFDCPDRVFFVVELATGGDLLDRMNERIQFGEHEVCHIVKNLLEGLKYLHSLAIAHCDLRPENILLYHPGKDARVIITDFGQSIECRDPDGVILTAPLHKASPEYLAPEILARIPASCSVDLWSVGVIAFTMLAAQLPFSDDSKPLLMRKILRGQYTFHEKNWEGVSAQSRNFIDRLLVVDAANRMTASQALRHAWIFATLGQGSAAESVGMGKAANGHVAGHAPSKDDNKRPESAGMFSLTDISIHSLRLAGSSSNHHSNHSAQSHHRTNNLRARNASAGASSVRSHDSAEVESTIDLSTVTGGVETDLYTDDNVSSVITDVSVRRKFKASSTVISE